MVSPERNITLAYFFRASVKREKCFVIFLPFVIVRKLLFCITDTQGKPSRVCVCVSLAKNFGQVLNLRVWAGPSHFKRTSVLLTNIGQGSKVSPGTNTKFGRASVTKKRVSLHQFLFNVKKTLLVLHQHSVPKIKRACCNTYQPNRSFKFDSMSWAVLFQKDLGFIDKYWTMLKSLPRDKH